MGPAAQAAAPMHWERPGAPLGPLYAATLPGKVHAAPCEVPALNPGDAVWWAPGGPPLYTTGVAPLPAPAPGPALGQAPDPAWPGVAAHCKRK
ncbi:hypothetical protein QBZ16_001377 [Prototheca wickerhamii]|uniref:Uncharacterized protein n=1 Tax=Prototheca wickerhamii TaxID=3111 RepID=A0AAD9IDG4_PROWI|nr:hypothetical protein QBZ16_001377 [Prototheca wickerhamii]